MKVINSLSLAKEIEIVQETVQRKDLSTSTELDREGEEEKMVRRVTPRVTRQDTKEVI